MKYLKLNIGWNAEPNSPEPKISINGNQIKIEFNLNSFIFENIGEDEKGELVFENCYKYSFNNCNDEGYFQGQYRFGNKDLPWGDFYQIESNWVEDFHEIYEVVNQDINKEKMQHFIFFFRDNTFECVAESFEFILK